MLSKKRYLEEYQQKYNSTYKKKNLQQSSNNQNFLIFICFLSLPLIFSFVLNIFILDKQFNEKKVSLNTYGNFADEIIYKSINKNNNSNLEIKNKHIILPSQNTHYISKFEGVKGALWNYTKNHSKFSDSLENVNLLVGLSEKKRKFIKTILPLAIDQNQKILNQREKLIEVKNYLNLHKTLKKEHQKFYENLSNEYLVVTNNKHKVDVIDELLIYVDIIPNSIVIAQAANESGWGSSRFSKDYNALFGQYTYDVEKGVIPLNRDEGKKHLIKYFTSIDESVESYFDNINTHYAYSEFRNFRKQLRNQNNLNDPIYTSLLVNKLKVYADANNYVDIINSIISVNKLTQFDNNKYLKTQL